MSPHTRSIKTGWFACEQRSFSVDPFYWAGDLGINLNLHLTVKSQLILKLLRKYVLLKDWFILFNKRNSILTVFFPTKTENKDFLMFSGRSKRIIGKKRVNLRINLLYSLWSIVKFSQATWVSQISMWSVTVLERDKFPYCCWNSLVLWNSFHMPTFYFFVRTYATST